MKVLVCGDRDWTDKEAIRRELVKLPPGTTIVHGDCRGADKLAGEVAEELGFQVVAVPANWDKFGDAAGPIRNQEMLDKHPDINLALAFHPNLNRSKGTKDMLRRVKAAKLTWALFRK